MAITLRKIQNPQARPITFDSNATCQHWAGCGSRAVFMIPKFMGQIRVCARHADS